MATSVPVRSGRGVAVMAAGFSIYALHGTAFYTLGIFLPDLVEALQTTDTAIALTGSLHCGLTFGCCIIIGGLIDTYDCHVISLTGNLLLGAGFILSGLCTEVYQLYITNGIITGIGLSMQFMPIGITMQRLFSAKSRHAVTGFVISGIPMGIFIFAPILRFLITTYGWRATYVLAGAFFLNGIPLAMLLRTRFSHHVDHFDQTPMSHQNDLRNVSPTSNDISQTSSKPLLSETDSYVRETRKNDDRKKVTLCPKYITDKKVGKICCRYLHSLFDFDLLRDVVYWFYLLALFMTGAGIQVPYAFLSIKALDCGLTSYHASLLFSCLGFSDTLGRVSIGLLTLRVAPMKAFLAALLLISFVNLLTPLLTSFPTLVVFAILFGFGHGGFQTAFYTAGAELLGVSALAKAMGPVFTLFAVAVSLSYPAAALLREYTGKVDTSFLYAGCTAILASFLVMLAVIKKNRDGPVSSRLQHTITIDIED